MGLRVLTIKYYKVNPDYTEFKRQDGEKNLKFFVRKVKLSFRRITPTTISLFRDAIFKLLKTESKVIVRLNQALFIEEKDIFIIKQWGDEETIKADKIRFQNFLTASIDKTVKTEKDIKSKIKRQYDKVKSKIFETSVKTFYTLGIGITVKDEPAKKNEKR